MDEKKKKSKRIMGKKKKKKGSFQKDRKGGKKKRKNSKSQNQKKRWKSCSVESNGKPNSDLRQGLDQLKQTALCEGEPKFWILLKTNWTAPKHIRRKGKQRNRGSKISGQQRSKKRIRVKHVPKAS